MVTLTMKKVICILSSFLFVACSYAGTSGTPPVKGASPVKGTLPANVEVQTLEIFTPTSSTGQPYKIYANRNNEAPITIQVGTSASISSADLAKAVTLFAEKTQTNYPREDSKKVVFGKSGADSTVYSSLNDSFDQQIPTGGPSMLSGVSKSAVKLAAVSDDPASYQQTVTFYFKTNQAQRFHVCARVAQADGKVVTSCDAYANDAYADINAVSPPVYSEGNFSVCSSYMSYYKYDPTLFSSWSINSYRLSNDIGQKGFHLSFLQDISDGRGGHWSNTQQRVLDTVEGMGGKDDGHTMPSLYRKTMGTLSTAATWARRFDQGGDFHEFDDSGCDTKGKMAWECNSWVWDKNEVHHQFYNKGNPYTFYVGVYHNMGNAVTSWGVVQPHEFTGYDNYGNSIDVSLPMCSGTSSEHYCQTTRPCTP